MDRGELEKLDRDALIARAEVAGVSRARILTRPELIDELLVRGARDGVSLERSRGLFGRARDLLARVVERGLHLPDAADLIRATRQPMPPARVTAAALPTVTLAEIYATQGHRDRAIETLRRVLEREADHGAARTLLAQLEDHAYVPPPPPLPPEDDPPVAALPEEEPPDLAPPVVPIVSPPARGEGVPVRAAETKAPVPPAAAAPPAAPAAPDECVALPLGPGALFACWRLGEGTRAYLRAARPGGALVLRLAVVEPTWEGPRTSLRDLPADDARGEALIRELPPGAVLRVALGLRVGPTFVPLAQSPALEAGRAHGEKAALVRWTPRGAAPIDDSDADAASILRALRLARAAAAGSPPPPAG